MQKSNIHMNSWVLRQLRGRVLTDLAELIPQNYFETEVENLKYNEGFVGAKLLSADSKWGYLAGTLGQKLYFHTCSPMTARQISASEVLMHLGMLTAIEASHSACEQLSQKAIKHNIPDGNSTVAARQMKTEHIPTLQMNLLLGLKQYLLHLSKEEARPFESLVQNTPVAPIHLF